VAISGTQWGGLVLAVVLAVKQGKRGVLGHYSALMAWSLGNKGAAWFVQGDRGEVQGTREMVRVASTVGHSAALPLSSPTPARCSINWSQEIFL